RIPASSLAAPALGNGGKEARVRRVERIAGLLVIALPLSGATGRRHPSPWRVIPALLGIRTFSSQIKKSPVEEEPHSFAALAVIQGIQGGRSCSNGWQCSAIHSARQESAGSHR
ncbi:hypothetical protein JOQ06_000392, partial [Pogonophryne albipinna]